MHCLSRMFKFFSHHLVNWDCNPKNLIHACRIVYFSRPCRFLVNWGCNPQDLSHERMTRLRRRTLGKLLMPLRQFASVRPTAFSWDSFQEAAQACGHLGKLQSQALRKKSQRLIILWMDQPQKQIPIQLKLNIHKKQCQRQIADDCGHSYSWLFIS